MKNTQPANRKKRVNEREEKRREEAEAEVRGDERTKVDAEKKGEGRRGVNSRGRTRMICRTRTNETAFFNAIQSETQTALHRREFFLL
jgi:hypothetical protein